MKTDYERNLELSLIVCMALICFLAACMTIGELRCGSLFIDCPGIEQDSTLDGSYMLLSTEIRGNTLYFRFRDCATNSVLQSSVSAHCIIEKL